MASRFNVSVARRCETRVKALRGEVKKDSIGSSMSFDSAAARLAAPACGPRRAPITVFARGASIETGACISYSATNTTSSSPGWADTQKMRTCTQMARRQFRDSAASAVVVIGNRRVARISTSRRPTRIWSDSSTRSVQRADVVGLDDEPS
jgi:hypothetical protein